MPAIAARAVRSAGPEALSISTRTLPRISLPAEYSTSPATSSAAIESACGCPARTSTSPISTATEPTRSSVKCSAFALSAALEY